MKKLRLNNLIYTTNDELRVQELIEMGAVVIEKGTPKKKEEVTINEQSKLTNLKVAELKELADEKGIEYNSNVTKNDLIELLEG